ncbi:MAG: lamin tail domain-containing protein [Saprospiraceae bacterium]|nr:lamin tail domain-containing protein [Saprospiraceae bacterium]
MKCKDILSYNKLTLSLLRYFMLYGLIGVSTDISAQINLDFDNGNINQVKWEGNINNFIINTEGQLQLNAAVAGESTIFTKFKVPKDSIQLDLYFKLQFAPSNDNFGKIYLFTDNKDETKANGYYLRLGENGSNDAIQVWKLTQGIGSLMASGKMGGISAEPADARIRCKIYRNGLWLVTTDYTGKTLYEDDIEFSDPAFSLPDATYFGIYCKYSASRIDKFFYDDIIYKTIERDTVPPLVLKAEVVNDSNLRLSFSESLDEVSVKNTAAYVADNGLGSPDLISYSTATPNEVTLTYTGGKIKSGKNYTLTINGVKDRSNNQKKQTISFVYAIKPVKGDLIITEVLTDPYSGGEDFIELYNASDKFIKLDSLILKNTQKNESKTLLTSDVLYPGRYVALSKNIDFLKTTYKTPDTANFIIATLPSLNVDGANITIISTSGNQPITIDSFDYSEKYHFQLIDETKGVSLEKISLKAPSNDANFWHSSSSLVLYATPGYKNSNLIKDNTATGSSKGLIPDKKVFTPNGDSIDDFVLLKYELAKPGYLATVRIYDAEGFAVADLANNLLLGTEGALKWDGIDGEGNIMRMGIYIVYSRLFHPDGDVIDSKQVVVVAQKF